MSKNILVTGATGFIGSNFCRRAIAEGYQLHGLTRDISAAREKLPEAVKFYNTLDDLPREIRFSTVLNLAGEPLVSGRWNKRRKAVFRQSRIGTTKALLSYFGQRESAPELLISGSAIGYYGPHSNRKLDESGTHKDSFSHQLCSDWEREAREFVNLSTRVCYLRTGIVLGNSEGALARMLPAFKLGLGGPIGRGNQWMSWIHIEDIIGLIFHCMERQDLSGAINATAPEPVRNKRFSKTLGRSLQRPAVLPMPSLLAKMLFGEMARELLLTGQCVIPRKAVETGFEFKYPDLPSALDNLLAK